MTADVALNDRAERSLHLARTPLIAMQPWLGVATTPVLDRRELFRTRVAKSVVRHRWPPQCAADPVGQRGENAFKICCEA